MLRQPIHHLRRRLVRLVHELAKFGTVGAAGMVVDLGLFNLLVFGSQVFDDNPLPARTLSIAAATVLTYLGNRYWTWRHTERRAMHREYALFFVLNGVGMAINLMVLWLATDVFGTSGPVWTNLANLTGIGLGTLFRFWSYRRFVFRAPGLDVAPTTSTTPTKALAGRAGSAPRDVPLEASAARSGRPPDLDER